jgi:DtxR family manganese transport transcriptional regulator
MATLWSSQAAAGSGLCRRSWLHSTSACGQVRSPAMTQTELHPPFPEADDGQATQARGFGKARTAQAVALLEDYAELIADLHAECGEARPTEIARRLGISHATAVKTISRLKREGLATSRPYRGVSLTAKGSQLAERTRARHRLVVDLLALGVPREAAEMDAEGIEHHVGESTLNAFAVFLRRRCEGG